MFSIVQEVVSNLRNLALILLSSEVNLFYLVAKIWELTPENIKSSESVDIFKNKIKKWVSEICPCRLCKTYVNQVGYVN